jgi:hypothetical protein
MTQGLDHDHWNLSLDTARLRRVWRHGAARRQDSDADASAAVQASGLVNEGAAS